MQACTAFDEWCSVVWGPEDHGHPTKVFGLVPYAQRFLQFLWIVWWCMHCRWWDLQSLCNLTLRNFVFKVFLHTLSQIGEPLPHRRSLGGAGGGHCPPRSEPIDFFVRSMNTKIFSHCLILFALSYFNEYVKAKLFVINVKKKKKKSYSHNWRISKYRVSGHSSRSLPASAKIR